VRIAELEDSARGASSRRTGASCASPGILRRHGTPGAPDELPGTTASPRLPTRYDLDCRPTAPPARCASRAQCCDNREVLRDWALPARGTLKSTRGRAPPLEDGSLVPLFPGYTFASDVAIWAVYPHRRHLSAKTRVFIDFLAESFGPEPYWDRPPSRSAKPRIKARSGV
jgi:DNA-binding transcriptional LysR family regulator